MAAAQRWGWVLLVAAVAGIGWSVQHSRSGSGAAGAPASPTAAATSSHSPTPSTTTTTPPDQNDTALFAPQVVRYAKQAGIHPQLLMAILYNESYKPHDPAFQRSWQKLKPDAAFGIANMHKAAFDDTRQGRDFASRNWQELPDDPGLAIEAAAYYLHDLARQLPTQRATALTEDELLALGYNTGSGNMRAFARGVSLGPLARTYLDTLHQNWAKAGADVKAAGA